MSESGSGDVTVAKITEGDQLSRSDINATNNSWEHVSERLTGQNIREEGLDRRVFKSDETWGNTAASGSKGIDASESFYSGTPKHIRIPDYKVDEWIPVGGLGMPGGGTTMPFKGGLSEDVCCVYWDWEPNLDTYCIIRCSFYMEFDIGDYGHQGRDSDGESVASKVRTEQFFKFGIAVKRLEPGTHSPYFLTEEYPHEGVRRIDNPDGNIFAVQQIGMHSRWSKYTSKKDTIRNQYDRRSKMTSSFTLIASGSSGENNHTYSLDNNMCAIDMREPGRYYAMLVVRRHKNFPDGTSIGMEAGGTGVLAPVPVTARNNAPKIGHVNMHVQKFRR